MADIVMADRTFSEGLRPAQPGQPDLRLRRGQIITRLAGEIKLFLDEHAGCRTKDDYYAQALLHLLKAPASGFQRDLAVDYVTRYGPPTSHKTCDYQLHVITSRMVVRVEDEGGGLVETARVHTSPFPLQAVSRGGLAVLQGATAVIYDQLELLFTDCPAAFEVSPYPTPSLQITDLRPIYDADDRVSNFTLQGVALDPITTTNAGHLTLDVDEAGNCTVERFDTTQEPVDTWGALFSGLHNPHLHTDNWTIAGEESYVATSQVVGLQQGSVTETTTMVLTVNQTEP